MALDEAADVVGEHDGPAREVAEHPVDPGHQRALQHLLVVVLASDEVGPPAGKGRDEGRHHVDACQHRRCRAPHGTYL